MQWNCSSCNPPVVLGRANCSAGCLYDVVSDPGEYNELSKAQPKKHAEMMARWGVLSVNDFAPDRGTKDPRACAVATGLYGGFWGPFAFVNETA